MGERKGKGKSLFREYQAPRHLAPQKYQGGTDPDYSQIDRYPTATMQANSPMVQYQNPQPTRAPARTLPDPGELAARIEEAKNSAKLLTQFVQITPQAELEENDLIKEFIDRCRTSARYLQGYIHSTNPPPDEETLLTLIETNDEISVALSQQQRAMLKARKARGSSTPTSNINSPSSPASDAVASGGLGSSPAPSASLPAVAAAATGPAPTQQTSAPVQTQRQSRSPEEQSAPVVELPSTFTVNRTTALRSHPEQYEYNSADFEVQNPFADENAASDSDAERPRQHVMTATTSTADGRVRILPTEQER